MAALPVYVLTAGSTFSAAAEFTYNLKNLRRATIVGETTGGGAHPVTARRFPDLGLSVSIPFGRAMNPITKTNWEGTGVVPDIVVAARDALQVAHEHAVATLLEAADPGSEHQRLEWTLEGLTISSDAVGQPIELILEYADGRRQSVPASDL